jgi:RND family efflux transporter MFP subunit
LLFIINHLSFIIMKVFYTGLAFACLLAACGKHTPPSSHEHEEEHEHGEAGGGHAGEIVFAEEKAAAVGLKTKTVQPEDFTEVIKVSGRIVSAQGDERTLVATVPGVVTFNHTQFVEGEAVKKGQAVLSLVSGHIREGDIALRTRTAFEKAESEYGRAKELVKERIISEKEFRQTVSDYETAKAAYDAIGRSADGAGVAVPSPMNGYLKNLRVKEGDYVETGQPLASVSQNNKLMLRAEVSEKYYGSLPLVHSANFRTPYDNRVYRLPDLNGRLLSYARSPGDDSFYIPVTFEFDNKGGVIPGSYVEIFLMTSPIPHTISVPVSSLIEEQGIYSVFIRLDEDCYRKQEVKPGAGNGADVQILSGLEAGDVVVTEAAYHLKLASASGAVPAHTHHH